MPAGKSFLDSFVVVFCLAHGPNWLVAILMDFRYFGLVPTGAIRSMLSFILSLARPLPVIVRWSSWWGMILASSGASTIFLSLQVR